MDSSFRADQILEEHAGQYHSLLIDKGKDSEQVIDEYRKLKTLIQVEIYFMESVRSIVTDEEMSGFILYMDDEKLHYVVDAFNPCRGSFISYLTFAMERRAIDYMRVQTRKKRIQSSYLLNYLPYEYDNYMSKIAEESPLYGDFAEEDEDKNDKPLPSQDKIRALCSASPTTQKRLFIFLCVYMPFLSLVQIEKFCDLLGFNKEQTFTLAERLYKATEEKQPRRLRVNERFRERRDLFWGKTVELETLIHRFASLDSEDPRILSLKRRLLRYKQGIEKGFDNRNKPKLRMEYPILGQVLHLSPSYIATAVYHSRHVIEMVMTQQDDTQSLIEVPNPKDFRPFEVFRISPTS